MIDQKLVKWGQSGNIIREIAEYGAEQAKIVGADHVYNFTIGSPSIDPPDCVFETMEKMRAAIPPAQLHTYAPAVGFPEVRAKAAEYLRNSFGIPYRAQDVIITCGTSTCLAVLTRVFLSCGGRAMTFTPYFMDYKYYAEACGSELTECPTDPDTFQINISEAEKEFLEFDRVREVLNRYCGYMAVPIYLENTADKPEPPKEGEEPKTPQPINDTHPLWLKAPNDSHTTKTTIAT